MDPLLGIFLAALFGFPPMAVFAVVLTWLDIYEKEPPLLLISVFLWGFSVAAGSAFLINTLFGLSIFLITVTEQVKARWTELSERQMFLSQEKQS